MLEKLEAASKAIGEMMDTIKPDPTPEAKPLPPKKKKFRMTKAARRVSATLYTSVERSIFALGDELVASLGWNIGTMLTLTDLEDGTFHLCRCEHGVGGFMLNRPPKFKNALRVTFPEIHPSLHVGNKTIVLDVKQHRCTTGRGLIISAPKKGA